MIQDADQASAERYGGHGSALAQVYNHIIMPLASERDARTQIRWGIVDFEHRFGRKPEGMWLAETAVSRACWTCWRRRASSSPSSLRTSAPACGRLPTKTRHSDFEAVAATESKDPDEIRPGSRYPFHHKHPWEETPECSVDTTHPYLIQLDAGRSITVFFYDGPGSRAIAFEGVLNDGEQFARRLLAGLQP
jgi:alpha-amylase/alpha-mannosidase (GH57 family)